MIVTILLVIIALAAVALLYAVFRHTPRINSAAELGARLTPVNLDAFVTLTDRSDAEYLSRLLSPSQFRRVQRSRIRAIFAYLNPLLGNTAIMIRIGQLAGSTDDPAIAAAGKKLADTALHTRFLVLRAYCTLVPQWIYPSGAEALSSGVLAGYAELNRCLIGVTSLEQFGAGVAHR